MYITFVCPNCGDSVDTDVDPLENGDHMQLSCINCKHTVTVDIIIEAEPKDAPPSED